MRSLFTIIFKYLEYLRQALRRLSRLSSWRNRFIPCLVLLLPAFVPANACPLIDFESSGTGNSGFQLSGTAWEAGANSARFHDGVLGLGNPIPLPGGATFSIMPGGLELHTDASSLSFLHGNNQTAPITNLNVPGLSSEEDYRDLFNEALNVWASVCGFENLGFLEDGTADAGAPEAENGHLGDIRIAAWEIIVNDARAVTFRPSTQSLFGPGGTVGGDLHLDLLDTTWVNDPNDAPNDGDFDFFTTVLHEMGHAIGIDHSLDNGAVMHSSYHGARCSLSLDDVLAAQALYGPLPDGDPPLVLAPPQSLEVVEGKAAVFKAVATGTAPLIYQWYKNGQPIGGATQPTLTLENVATDDAGIYDLLIINGVGQVASSPACVTVISPLTLSGEGNQAELSITYTHPRGIEGTTHSVVRSNDLSTWTGAGVTEHFLMN